MTDPQSRYWIAFNGEIYNYIELRRELEQQYNFRTQTDTEVLLAAFVRWGTSCLDRLIGMFSFLIWDDQQQLLFGARDRFGVKPLYYHLDGISLTIASEIKAIHACGIDRRPNVQIWADYLCHGLYDHSCETFWDGIQSFPPGGSFTWTPRGGLKCGVWYDIRARVLAAGFDERTDAAVESDLLAVLDDSVRLRFRADVPVGVCLSGGFDSSLLLALVGRATSSSQRLHTFTFICGDDRYDEHPWVEAMLRNTAHTCHLCKLDASTIPALAEAVQEYQDEPFGGFPTLGMAKVHEAARKHGVVVLLDGNGLDEGWGGYDYYRRQLVTPVPTVQGALDPITRPNCVNESIRRLARDRRQLEPQLQDLRDLQIRDLRYTKIPRAMRFSDRVSMMYSRELREPFLDHRLVELGLRQPRGRKVNQSTGKLLPRQMAKGILPTGLVEAPKRPVQTPQREWLRGQLKAWTETCIESAFSGPAAGWLCRKAVKAEWKRYCRGESDNSFYVWQWISLGLMMGR